MHNAPMKSWNRLGVVPLVRTDADERNGKALQLPAGVFSTVKALSSLTGQAGSDASLEPTDARP